MSHIMMLSDQVMYITYLHRTVQVRYWGTGASNPWARLFLATKSTAKPRKDRSKRKRHMPAHRLRDTELRIIEVNIRGLPMHQRKNLPLS